MLQLCARGKISPTDTRLDEVDVIGHRATRHALQDQDVWLLLGARAQELRRNRCSSGNYRRIVALVALSGPARGCGDD